VLGQRGGEALLLRVVRRGRARDEVGGDPMSCHAIAKDIRASNCMIF